MADLELREGSIEPITFTLSRNYAAYDLTGKAIRMRRRSGTHIDDLFTSTDVSPRLAVTTAASGIVTFTPLSTTWKGVSAEYEYFLYFEVEVTAGKWYAWAEAIDIKIKIIPKFG